MPTFIENLMPAQPRVLLTITKQYRLIPSIEEYHKKEKPHSAPLVDQGIQTRTCQKLLTLRYQISWIWLSATVCPRSMLMEHSLFLPYWSIKYSSRWRIILHTGEFPMISCCRMARRIGTAECEFGLFHTTSPRPLALGGYQCPPDPWSPTPPAVRRHRSESSRITQRFWWLIV